MPIKSLIDTDALTHPAIVDQKESLVMKLVSFRFQNYDSFGGLG